jgi:DNA-binding winged helix-turn-helix (wHTH) protein
MKLVFCDCLFESTARQLWRGGKVVPLEPKMYQLLDILIKRRPAVVSNNELHEILWPHVFVARTSLARLVSELRTVLGDTSRDSHIIRTAYKTGYAFCAEVVTAPDSAAKTAATIHLLWNERLMPLAEGEHIAGRGEDCSLVIDATTVSRRHARFVVNGGAVTVEDLESTNGTHVNGTRITAPTALSNGNRVELGSEMLVMMKRDPSALTVRSERRAAIPSNR